MRLCWLGSLCPLLLYGVESSPTPGPEAPPTGPKPFPSSHYSLIQEYSPFVKSMESAKETEKSPDLVVVGYGRIGGENHVIIQLKDNSEKREKIGSRFGSKDFPYRLLSVSNASDRKKFTAVLEDRNSRKLKISYASEAASAAPGPVSAAPASSPAPVANNPGVEARRSVGDAVPPGLSGAGLGVPPAQPTVEQLQQEIQDLEGKINKPGLTEAARQRGMDRLEAKKRQLQALQNPQEIEAAAPAPEPAP